ncbi:MFS transporter [Nocardiopsis changdeensis]|uniref:MHS family MFS transporter n=1 Tax=Nocardiopsis changdeensis TaxID=2831969 RepID=A0ABX8BDR1_9ACTN|nr:MULTISPECIES: MFS transporter [Nocardiopsis]QUX20172.1 MHS family MFS transporter [Nocardiopsis changdeensis]QYX36100.1 MHS family MFS transporter [Nocardiopsis sp. MT53]
MTDVAEQHPAPERGTPAPVDPPTNPRRKVLTASLVGTSVEFYDFYIYATAAVLVFPALFFPEGDMMAARLQSLATFAIAFVARPIGSWVFGHFGDRVGRKATLVASLLTMGIATVGIGVLPTYAQVGVLAPLLLALCRFGQGLGLGGEWGGAALLATENAPAGKRGFYGTFPQLGAPIGFFLANGVFLILSQAMSEETFLAWGWRVPFLLSTILIVVGLWVRLSLHETPAFAKVLAAGEQVRTPIVEVFRRNWAALILGTLVMVATYVLFYLMTVFSLGFGTDPETGLGYDRSQFLVFLLVGVVFFGIFTPVAGLLSDRFGRKPVLVAVTAAIIVFGFAMGPLLGSGTVGVLAFLVIGLSLMGLTFGPMAAVLPELFPTNVRYTGASAAYNLAGLLGASFAPYIATWLAGTFGIAWVGGYLVLVSVITLVALLLTRETRDDSLDDTPVRVTARG